MYKVYIRWEHSLTDGPVWIYMFIWQPQIVWFVSQPRRDYYMQLLSSLIKFKRKNMTLYIFELCWTEAFGEVSLHHQAWHKQNGLGAQTLMYPYWTRASHMYMTICIQYTGHQVKRSSSTGVIQYTGHPVHRSSSLRLFILDVVCITLPSVLSAHE